MRGRLTFYNPTINCKPVMMYGSVIWESTSTNNIKRVFWLQKRAARVILGIRTKEERRIKLFKKLEWLPFYDEINVIKLCLVFKCLNGQCPEYMTQFSDTSTRQSRNGSITLRCPKYSRETEARRTFAVEAVKEWNRLPINILSSQNVQLLKNNYISYTGLDHFYIS